MQPQELNRLADGLPEFVLDGTAFNDLAGFFATVSTALGTVGWERSSSTHTSTFSEASARSRPSTNLDSFNDILRGGFGTPEGGFVLRWSHSNVSAERLGWPETIRWIEKKLTTCQPNNVLSVEADLQAARHGNSQTLFEIIVDIITTHGPGGREAEDNVHLVLA